MYRLPFFAVGLIVALLLEGSLARAALVIVPGSAAAMEGDNNSVVPFNTAARTNQYQMTNAALGSIPVGSVISAIQFRMDGGQGIAPGGSITWSDYEITFAKASNAIGSMSSTLASNMQSPIVVKDGSFTLTANSLPGTGSPRDFGGTINLDTAYTYTGGDLVMLLTHTAAGTGTTPTVDGILTDSLGTGGIRALSTPAGFQVAMADNTAFRFPVMQFVYTVPEPSSVALGSIGLIVGLGLIARQRRQLPVAA